MPVLLKLYIDSEGEVFDKQEELEQDMFNIVALSYDTVLSPDGKTISFFPGLTRNVPEFVDFLKKAQN